MSFLEKIKKNKKTKISSAASSVITVKTISEDFIPFASYLDSNTVITKNGDLMQVIEIICNDNNANLKGKLQGEIREALMKAFGNEVYKYSFWIHVMKSPYQKIPSNEMKYSGYNYFSSYLHEEWDKNQKTFNNFYTIIYVTILRAGMSFSLKPNNLFLYTNKNLLFKTHNVYIKRGASQLDKCANKVMASLKNYSTRKLSIVEGETYNSDHLGFWHQLLNFGKEQYAVPLASLAATVNKSKYSFGFNSGVMKNGDIKKFFSIFTIKDSYNITSSSISSLVESSDNLILFENCHAILPKIAKAKYAKQMDIFKKNINQNMLQVFGLETLDKDNDEKNKDDKNEGRQNYFFKQYLGIVIIANSYEELKKHIDLLLKNAISTGIIMVLEDVGLERCFYSMLPGNFKFVKHNNIITQNEICVMANSYAMDNENISFYRDEKYLMLLPTLKKYPYAFGIIKDKQDIIISGPKYNNFQTTIFTHFILSQCFKLNHDMYMIGSYDESYCFALATQSMHFKVSKIAKENEFYINLSSKDKPGKQYASYIINVVIMMLLAENHKPSKEEITFISSSLTSLLLSVKNIDMNIIYGALKGNAVIEPLLFKWLPREENDEGLSHLFSNAQDSFNEFEENCKYNNEIYGNEANNMLIISLKENMAKNSHYNALLTYIFLQKIENIINPAKGSIIVINNSLQTFDHPIFKGRLENIIIRLREKGAFFIFINDDSKESLAPKKNLNQLSLFAKSSTSIHLSGVNVNEEYIRTYELSNPEGYALKSLANRVNSALIKQNGLVVPVFLSLDNLPALVQKIMKNHNDIIIDIEKMINNNISVKDSNIWVKAIADGKFQEMIDNHLIIKNDFGDKKTEDKKDDDSNFENNEHEERDMAKAKEILNAA